MKKKIMLSLLVITILGLSACGKKDDYKVSTDVKSNNELEVTENLSGSLVDKASIDTIENGSVDIVLEDYTPKYNDYKTYSLAEAVKQGWFNQIGEYEVSDFKHSNDYEYICRCILGYSEDSNISYMMPDEIVVQGKVFKKDAFQRHVFKAENVEAGLYEFIRSLEGYYNYDKSLEYSKEDIENYIDSKYNYTSERVQELYDIATEISSEDDANELKQKYQHGMVETVHLDLSNLVDLADFDDLTLISKTIAKTDVQSIPVYYELYLQSDKRDPEHTQVLLVYDDLGVNVDFSHYENDSGDTYYTGDLKWYSGILNREEVETILGKEITHPNMVN